MNQIRRFREEKQMSQKQLANVVGASSDSIGRYERDERDIPSSILKKIADVLECTTNDLLSDEENPPPAPAAGAKKQKPRPIIRNKRKVA